MDAAVAQAMHDVWVRKEAELCRVVHAHVSQLAPVRALRDTGGAFAFCSSSRRYVRTPPSTTGKPQPIRGAVSDTQLRVLALDMTRQGYA